MESISFSKEKLQEALPRLNWVTPGPPVDEALAYAAFYGLDFFREFKTLKYHIGYFEAGFERIATQLFIQEKAHATVLVCHGYYDHAGIYNKLVRALVEDRYNVVVYDLPGHGLSTGSEVCIHSFDEYQMILDECLYFMEGNLPKPWHAVGQSTGGAILMHHALHRNTESPFNRQVLFAPLVRPVSWTKNKLTYHIVSPFRSYIKRKFVPNSHDTEFLEFLEYRDILQSRRLSSRWVGSLKEWIDWYENTPQVSSLPTLLIQGKEDATVDWRHNIPVIQQRFSNVELLFVPQGRHQLVNEAQQYRELMFTHMLDYLRKEKPDSTPNGEHENEKA